MNFSAPEVFLGLLLWPASCRIAPRVWERINVKTDFPLLNYKEIADLPPGVISHEID